MTSAAAIGEQNNPLFIKGKCFNDCETILTVGEEKTELYVCMDYLSKLSDYFRTMFYGDFREKYKKQFQINDESTEDVICFLNAIDPNPNVQKIGDDSIELLMRLADKYHCGALRDRLKIHIESHRNDRTTSASTILDWLVWSVKYNMPEEFVNMCLPGAACVPLSTLRENRDNIGLELFDKLNEAKFKMLSMAARFYYEEKGKGTVYSCRNCSVTLGLLPYRFCNRRFQNEYYSNHARKLIYHATSCINCPKTAGCSTETGHIACIYYYKCPRCTSDPATYQNQDQCFCARKNYQILFSETS